MKSYPLEFVKKLPPLLIFNARSCSNLLDSVYTLVYIYKRFEKKKKKNQNVCLVFLLLQRCLRLNMKLVDRWAVMQQTIRFILLSSIAALFHFSFTFRFHFSFHCCAFPFLPNMDYIYEFFKKCKEVKSIPTLSNFITKYRALVIHNVEYAEEVVTWKTTKEYWTNRFGEALQLASVR